MAFSLTLTVYNTYLLLCVCLCVFCAHIPQLIVWRSILDTNWEFGCIVSVFATTHTDITLICVESVMICQHCVWTQRCVHLYQQHAHWNCHMWFGPWCRCSLDWNWSHHCDCVRKHTHKHVSVASWVDNSNIVIVVKMSSPDVVDRVDCQNCVWILWWLCCQKVRSSRLFWCYTINVRVVDTNHSWMSQLSYVYRCVCCIVHVLCCIAITVLHNKLF